MLHRGKDCQRLTAEEEGGGEEGYEHREALTFLDCCIHRKQQAEIKERDREGYQQQVGHSVTVSRKYS